MDEHKEKAEHKFREESPEQQQPRKQEVAAAAKEERNYKESMDQHHRQDEKSTDEPPVLVKDEEVETGAPDEACWSPAPLFGVLLAHPWSLLQYLLRVCAGWFRGLLHGAFIDGPKLHQQAAAPPPEAVAPANSTAEQGDGGGGGGEKTNYFYMQEVVTRVWAVRKGRPSSSREGTGGNGGLHH